MKKEISRRNSASLNRFCICASRTIVVVSCNQVAHVLHATQTVSFGTFLLFTLGA